MSPERAIRIRLLAHLPWGGLLPSEVATPTPMEEAGAFVVPGPRHLPLRPHLELNSGPGGLVARVLGPEGLPRPLAVRPRHPAPLVPLPGPPLSLAARRDGGLWSLERERLVLLSASGALEASVPLTGVRLVGAEEDGAWVLGLEQATRVLADGRIQAPFELRDPLGAVASDGDLCTLEGLEPRGVRCLDARGRSTFLPLANPPGPFERLLALSEDAVLTGSVDTVRGYGRDGTLHQELRVLGSGVSARGAPFLSSVEPSSALLWVGEEPEARRLPLAPAGLEGQSPAVLAVEDERVLLWAGGLGAWYRESTLERAFTVDDALYARELFPRAWRVASPYPFVAEREGGILIPASGPSGLALVELRWAPGTGAP